MKEFTVILYSGGNNRLSTNLSIPKCLLPIGNRPLIWYSLQIIQSHSLLSSLTLLILTSDKYQQVLDDYLSALNITYEIIIYRQYHESTTNNQEQTEDKLDTLDILHSCYSRIKTELIVRDASLSMLLIKRTTSITTGKESFVQPGEKIKFTTVRDFYTIDQSTNAIISIRIKANSDKYLLLKQNILAKYPRTIIRQDLVDAHLYLIKKSCLDIAIRSNSSSFRKKFLPEIIQRIATGQSLEDLISTSANVTMMMRQKDFSDYVVGDGHVIGGKTIAKRTIIGKNCQIENECKIANCVLLDNVYVKEGVTLENSILCSHSTIESKCEIQNLIVCSHQQVEAES
ncbi:unnamed protein product [Rotaria sp. Silwood2]|nr:unnamed protein product [Rotaria sp. Silwood2]